MHVLSDTQVLLWAAVTPERIPSEICAMLADPINVLHYSAASIWEVSIKQALAKADFNVDPSILRRGLDDAGYRELAITAEHTLGLTSLPDHHKDPFDRILIAQCIHEGMLLLTADTLVARYPGPIRHFAPAQSQ